MIKFNSTKTYKKALLGGMSVVAFSAMVGGTAFAAPSTIAGANAGAATDVTATPTTLDTSSDDVFGVIDANGNVTFTGAAGETDGTFDIDNTATLYVFDSDAGAADTLAINDDADGGGVGSINVAAGKTLNVFVGVDNAGANKNNVNLTVVGDVVGADGTSIVNFTTDATSTSTLTFNGDADLSTGSITLGNANDVVVVATDAKTLTGNIVAASGGGGTLTLVQGANVIGTIGATDAKLTKINLGAGTGEDNSLTGNVFADELAFNNGTVAADSASTITGQTVEVGTITTGTAGVLGAGTGDVIFKADTGVSTVSVTGNIGSATNFISLVQIDDNGQTSNTLKLNGTTAQTIYADDVAGNGGNEDIAITNTAGVEFKGTVGVGAAIRNITVGSDGVSSSVIFNGAVTASALKLGGAAGSTEDTYTTTFNAASGYSVGATISGEDASDSVTINVYDTDDGDGDDVVTFTGAISGVDTLNVGSATGKSGSGKFDGTVAATNINVNAGNTAGNNAIADFNENVTATTITLTANATGGTSTATFAKDVTSAIVLDDDTESAIATFDGTIAQSVTGAVDGAAAGEGVLNVNNSHANGATFETAIGGTNALAEIHVGESGNTAANANFKANVSATAINLGDGANTNTVTMTVQAQGSDLTVAGTIDGDGAAADTAILAVTDATADSAPNVVTFSGVIGGTNAVDQINIGTSTAAGSATFSETVKAGTISIVGGDNAEEDSVGTFAKDVTATTITLDDNSGTASITFNGTAAQTVTGDITTAAGSEGAINANNDVTVVGRVGANAVGALNVATGKTFTIKTDATAGAIDTTTLTGTGALALDTTNATGAYTFTGAIAAAADGDGSVTITGAEDATIVGNIGTSTNDVGSIAVNGLTTAKAATFTGNVYANGLSIDATNATDENTVTFSTGANTVAITGNITSAEDGEHTLDFAAATAQSVTGNIGASGAAFKQVTATESLTVTGDIYSTAVTVDNSKTLTLDGTAATISGTVDGDGAGQGTVDVANASGTVTFSGKLGNTNQLAEIEISSGSTAVFNETVDTALLDVDGTATFNAKNNIVDGGTLDFADNSKIIIGSSVAAGDTVFEGSTGGVTTTTTGTDAKITVEMSSSFSSGEIRLIHSNGAHGVDSKDFVLTDTALVDYEFDTDGHATFDGDGNEVVITATKRTTAEIATELGSSTQVANALDNANQSIIAAIAAGGDDLALNQSIQAALNTALNAGGTTATNAAEQIAVQADVLGAVANAAVSVGTQSFATTSGRLASLRTGEQYADGTGLAAGEHGKHSAGWVKAFGNWASQDEKDGIAGYDADTAGVAFGADTEVAPGVRLGGSFSYAVTDVEGEGAGNAEVDIDSYQFTVYGDYTADTYYIEGAIGYATNENDSSRVVNFGGLNQTATADYDSDQIMVSVSGGMPMHIEGETYITPTAGFSYTNVSSDSYTETGAGGLNQTVNPDDVEAAILALGAKFHTSIKQGEGVLIPSGRVGVSYDLAGDEAEATATYTGGGAAFKTTGAETEEFGFNVGLGLAYEDADWSVGVNYDGEFKSDYDSHSATLEARFKF